MSEQKVSFTELAETLAVNIASMATAAMVPNHGDVTRAISCLERLPPEHDYVRRLAIRGMREAVDSVAKNMAEAPMLGELEMDDDFWPEDD